jgi:uracil-DNA glycosylase
VFFGGFAHKKGLKIDRNKHLVLESGHPSPLSQSRKVVWYKHFSKTNVYLEQHNKGAID